MDSNGVEFLLPHSWCETPNASAGLQPFVVVSWNVLADGYAQDAFARYLGNATTWDHRGPLLLQHIDGLKPDVLCMQEVTRFEEFWRPELEKRGYSGYLHTKPITNATLGPIADGCATFVSGRFEVLATENLKFRIMYNNQVALLVHLRDKVTGRELMVCNTHLKANMNGSRKRLQQMRQVLDHAKVYQSDGASVPIVVCGDLNEDNRTIGGVIRMMVNEHLVNAHEGAPLAFTSMDFTKGFMSVLDHIYHDRDRLVTRRHLMPPPREALGERGIPSEWFPSDHFALAVEMAHLAAC